jgi:hypothetical protein
MLSAIKLRLSDRTIELGYTLLRLVADVPSRSTSFWRALVPSSLAGDRPRMAGGEVGGGAGMEPFFPRQDTSIGRAGGVS